MKLPISHAVFFKLLKIHSGIWVKIQVHAIFFTFVHHCTPRKFGFSVPTVSSLMSTIHVSGVGPLKVVDYLQNLRMWISQTVLKRLVQEIEETNSKLIKLGMSDERIGKTDVEKLRRVAVQHHILLQVLTFLVNDSHFWALSGYHWNSLPIKAENILTSLIGWPGVFNRFSLNSWHPKLKKFAFGFLKASQISSLTQVSGLFEAQKMFSFV